MHNEEENSDNKINDYFESRKATVPPNEKIVIPTPIAEMRGIFKGLDTNIIRD